MVVYAVNYRGSKDTFISGNLSKLMLGSHCRFWSMRLFLDCSYMLRSIYILGAWRNMCPFELVTFYWIAHLEIQWCYFIKPSLSYSVVVVANHCRNHSWHAPLLHSIYNSRKSKSKIAENEVTSEISQPSISDNRPSDEPDLSEGKQLSFNMGITNTIYQIDSIPVRIRQQSGLKWNSYAFRTCI